MLTKLDSRSGYEMLRQEEIGPSDDRLTVTKFRTPSRECGRRYLVHDASGAEVFDTEDCYDTGNALHKLLDFLGKRDAEYAMNHAAPAVSGA